MKYTHDKVGIPLCEYLERWILQFKNFSLRLHRWLGSDDQRHHHDHEWWYISLVLWGIYDDITPTGTIRRYPLSIAFRSATSQHKVKLVSKTCWTLLLTGRKERNFGFWVNGKFRKRNKYFFEHGHHPCD